MTTSNTDFQTFARAVAKALGGKVTDTNEGHYAVIGLADVSIDLHTWGASAGRGNERKVSAGLPTLRWRDAEGNQQYAVARDSLDYNERDSVTLKINVSMARGAEACARDITRRLLPQARTVWAKMLARRDSAMEYSAATVATRNMLATLLGVEPRGNTLYVDGATLTVQGDRVKFERLSTVTLAAAMQLVAVLKAEADTND